MPDPPNVVRTCTYRSSNPPSRSGSAVLGLPLDDRAGEDNRQVIQARPGRGRLDKDYEFNAHGVDLGQFYESAAIVPDGSQRPQPTRDPELYYQPPPSPARTCRTRGSATPAAPAVICYLKPELGNLTRCASCPGRA